jgi:pilus assembly protein CpaD
MTLNHTIHGFRTIGLALGVIAGTALVAACGPNNTYFPVRSGYIEAPPRVSASLSSLNYRMELGRGQTALTRAQIDGLNRFLGTNGEADGDHVEIRTSLTSGPNRNGAIAGALRDSFLAGGYAPSRVEIIETADHGDVVEVVIQRYTAMIPDCGQEISRPAGMMEWSDEPVSIRKLGCSNEADLGLMVADPRDLAGGRQLGDSPGYHDAAVVKRYRDDKVKVLESLSTTKKTN